MRAEIVSAIESLTGCKVIASMSANSLEGDPTAEVLVLDHAVGGEVPAGRAAQP